MTMCAEEAHYLKKLELLQKTIESKVVRCRQNYLGIASWNRETKTYKILKVHQTSKHNLNHIEVDCLDTLEDHKKNMDIFYIFAKKSPCERCSDTLIQWVQNNKRNMVIFGFGFLNRDFNIYKIKSFYPNNLIIFDMSKKKMLQKEERRQNLNETYTKESFQELLSRMERSFQKSAEKQKVLKPIINSPKPPTRIKMNNFVKCHKVQGVDIEKEKVIINKLIRMKKSKDDLFSDSSLETSPIGSGNRRHKQLKPIS